MPVSVMPYRSNSTWPDSSCHLQPTTTKGDGNLGDAGEYVASHQYSRSISSQGNLRCSHRSYLQHAQRNLLLLVANRLALAVDLGNWEVYPCQQHSPPHPPPPSSVGPAGKHETATVVA